MMTPTPFPPPPVLFNSPALDFLAAVVLAAVLISGLLSLWFRSYPEKDIRRANQESARQYHARRDSIHLDPWAPGFDRELRKHNARLINAELGRSVMHHPVDVFIHGRPAALNGQNWGARMAADSMMQNDQDYRVHFTQDDEPGAPYTRPVLNGRPAAYHTPRGRQVARGWSKDN